MDRVEFIFIIIEFVFIIIEGILQTIQIKQGNKMQKDIDQIKQKMKGSN